MLERVAVSRRVGFLVFRGFFAGSKVPIPWASTQKSWPEVRLAFYISNVNVITAYHVDAQDVPV